MVQIEVSHAFTIHVRGAGGTIDQTSPNRKHCYFHGSGCLQDTPQPPKNRSIPRPARSFGGPRKLLKEFRELYGYGAMGFCSKEDQIVGPEAEGFLGVVSSGGSRPPPVWVIQEDVMAVLSPTKTRSSRSNCLRIS